MALVSGGKEEGFWHFIPSGFLGAGVVFEGWARRERGGMRD